MDPATIYLAAYAAYSAGSAIYKHVKARTSVEGQVRRMAKDRMKKMMAGELVSDQELQAYREQQSAQANMAAQAQQAQIARAQQAQTGGSGFMPGALAQSSAAIGAQAQKEIDKTGAQADTWKANLTRDRQRQAMGLWKDKQAGDRQRQADAQQSAAQVMDTFSAMQAADQNSASKQ